MSSHSQLSFRWAAKANRSNTDDSSLSQSVVILLYSNHYGSIGGLCFDVVTDDMREVWLLRFKLLQSLYFLHANCPISSL